MNRDDSSFDNIDPGTLNLKKILLLGGKSEHDTYSDNTSENFILEALHAIRLHLGMEVAFISELNEDLRTFRYVDREDDAPLIEVGGSDPKEESYCQWVIDEKLPQLMTDATQNPLARQLPATLQIPVGAHISVPIQMPDGSIYGTFCCFDRKGDESLNERDLSMMRVFADFTARQLQRSGLIYNEIRNVENRIKRVLSERLFFTVFQPMYNLTKNRVAGFEALTRFTAEPPQRPDEWFDDAAKVGLRKELELATIELALEALPTLPKTTYMSFNASAETILGNQLTDLLSPYPLNRLMLEITEHDIVEDYLSLSAALADLRTQGLHIAIDDAGAGYASFRHILKLAPDVIKLDQSLTHDIDKRHDSRALAAALVGFAEETGCRLVAEGVETETELRVLQEIGVSKAQGYLLGKPKPLPFTV